MNMSKFVLSLMAFVAIFVLAGCGGNGGGTPNITRSTGFVGNWIAFGFQAHDDGTTGIIEFHDLVVDKEGSINGTYIVRHFDTNFQGTVTDDGFFSGTIDDAYKPYPASLYGTFYSNSRGGGGGGGGGGENSVYLYADLVRIVNKELYPSLGDTNLLGNQFRSDVAFMMIDNSAGDRSDFWTGKTPKDYLALLHKKH